MLSERFNWILSLINRHFKTKGRKLKGKRCPYCNKLIEIRIGLCEKDSDKFINFSPKRMARFVRHCKRERLSGLVCAICKKDISYMSEKDNYSFCSSCEKSF